MVTSPFLEAGAKVKNLSVKLPDGSVLFSADNIKGKVFLPSLLWLSVRVTCAEVQSPFLNVEIMNGEKFKVAKVYEDIINRQRAERRANPQNFVEEENSLPIDISKIKVYVPAFKLNNYQAVIDDIKAGHKLTLRGDELKLGYFNGKVAKLKTNAEFLSDEEKNVLVESWLNESNELVVNNYGFDSFEDALDAIGEKKEITTNIEEYNANIIEQMNISLEKMADYWGFDSIEGVEQYFAIKTGSNQDDINALSPQDRVIRESFENIYNYFNGQMKTPGSSFEGEIIGDETLNKLNNELIANETVFKSVYEGFFENHDKYFYANNLNAQMIGDNLLNSVGGDNIPSAEKSSLWDRLLDVIPAMNNSMGGTGGTGGDLDFPDDIATGIVGAGVGAFTGATIVTAVKGRKVIGAKREMKRYKKFDETQTAIKIEKEREVDYNASRARDI